MYCVKIKDVYGRDVVLEVSFEVYQLFEEERKELERERFERRKHWDKRGLEDYIIGNESFAASETLEDEFFQRETLHTVQNVIESCTPVQRERFYLHFACGYSYAQIACSHSCTKHAVQKSVETVLKKIRDTL